MRYFLNLFLVVVTAIFLSACSTKEVYEPALVQGDWNNEKDMDEEIIDRAYNVAQTEDLKVLSQEGILDISVDEEKRVVALSDGWVITASIDGNITLIRKDDANITKNIDVEDTVAAASVKGNLLAVLFANNDMAIYDLASKKAIFHEPGGKSLAEDMRIVNPYFMKDLVIFATLDGKITIVNVPLKKVLRTVIVSSEDKFNNVIYLNFVNNKIIAATGYKLLSLAQNEQRNKYEIRNIIDDGKMIYLATKQGEVIALTPGLDVSLKVKFPFAHILGMISRGDTLYVLEKEGYLITIDKETFDYKVYETDFDEGYAFTGKHTFYVDDTEILTDSSN